MDPVELVLFIGDENGTSHTSRRSPVPARYLPGPDAEYGDFYGGARVECSIDAKLLNEKEVKTGLRDVVLAFDGSPSLEKPMLDRSTWRSRNPSGISYGGTWTNWRSPTCLRRSGSRYP